MPHHVRQPALEISRAGHHSVQPLDLPLRGGGRISRGFCFALGLHRFLFRLFLRPVFARGEPFVHPGRNVFRREGTLLLPPQ